VSLSNHEQKVCPFAFVLRQAQDERSHLQPPSAPSVADLRYDALMVLTTEQQAVAEANDAFYEALTRRDLNAMERLWFPADWVECVHPGMAPMRGWDAVRESWAVLFAAAGSLLVAATDVHIRLIGDVAWVSCAERIAMRSDGRMASSMAHATNVFVRHDHAWRLVAHHASAVPFIAPPQSDGATTVN
jgi:ketosteroid isomerase-like protein